MRRSPAEPDRVATVADVRKFLNPRLTALIAAGVAGLGIVGWQTYSALSVGDTVPAYAVAPPAGLSEIEDPTIIDQEALAEPLIPDADAEALLTAAQADFPLIGSLSPDVAALAKRIGSRELAESIANSLAASATALAGAQAGEPTFALSRFSGDDGTVLASTTYFPPNGSPVSVSIEMAYTRIEGGWRLASAALTQGVGA